MKNKKAAFLCGLLIGTMLIGMTGCSSNTENKTASAVEQTQTESEAVSGENTFAYEDDSKDAPSGETVMAMVTDVSGNTVTLSTGGGPGNGGAPGDSSSDGQKPDGNPPSDGQKPDGNPPSDGQKPDGEMPAGDTATLTIGEESVIVVSSSGEESEGSLSDITKGSMLSITFDETGAITKITVTQGMGGGPGENQTSAVDSYDAVTTYTEDTATQSETYASTGTDENAVLVQDGANVTLQDMTLTRTSDDSTGGDASSFYGVGAGLLVTDGTAAVKGGNVTTDAAGGAGLFAYGDGTVNASNVTIATKKDTSGGIHVAGGGTLYASDLSVTTEGESSAAIRSDRGGGTMVVDGGTYESHGTGSPSVYCTADIAVKNATLTATGSEAICMEGLNTIHLFNCDITGNMSDDKRNDTTWNVIVYQSMSGDAEVGNSTMQLIGGSITAKNGGMFYTTNTESNILLSDVDITYADDSDFFLQCTGNNNQRGWGQTGSNGADCVFTADKQEMEGKIIWDSISDLDFYMTNGSKLTGSFVQDETWAGDGGDGYANVTISSDSTWIVTGDSIVTSLNNEGTITDESGKSVSVVGTDGTVYVKGDSTYTITVENYSDTADLSGAATAADESDYTVKDAA